MSETTTTTTKAPEKRLEHVTCSRCCGTGHFSYCQRYGTTCFKCGGRKYTLTKRGEAAAQYLSGLRSKPVQELQPGDRIRATQVTMGGEVYLAWETVQAVEPAVRLKMHHGAGITHSTVEPAGLEAWKTQCEAGVMGPILWEESPSLVLVTNRGRHYGAEAKRYRVAQNAEDAARTFALAEAYQATLTKEGKPRKVLARKGAVA